MGTNKIKKRFPIRDLNKNREGSVYMAEGGFVVKFDGKKIESCYAVAFDYDDWQYVINDTEKHELPAGVRSITIEVAEK